MTSTTAKNRSSLQQRLFPDGIPRLWAPTLTHFHGPAALDSERIHRHMHSIAPYAKGLLIPGSTGEGWQMNDDDIEALLTLAIPMASALGLKVLIGVLKTDLPAVLKCIERFEHWLRYPGVVGFTVCPVKGKEFDQPTLVDSLRNVLQIGHPIAVYQLPQVTENELSPHSVGELASEFHNFILFKDTSGADRVAESGVELEGVFMVRGSESQGYDRWMKTGGGNYDGFLLSSANVFASQLAQMQNLQDRGELDEAKQLSKRIEAAISKSFERVTSFAEGNPFTNANKLIDHIMAFGSHWSEKPAPMLYSGTRLPMEWIEATARLLEEMSFFPELGYMQ